MCAAALKPSPMERCATHRSMGEGRGCLIGLLFHLSRSYTLVHGLLPFVGNRQFLFFLFTLFTNAKNCCKIKQSTI